ncbi:MAG: PilZ domain-containing protein [Deltaproteobacteria bacterium]|nr:PilZ domain-containing protein [Deltaproteobacteria bacterium]
MEDRRLFERIPLALQVRCAAGGRVMGSGTTINISREGTRIELYTEQRLEIGSQVDLKIEVPSRAEPLSAELLITWLNPLADAKRYGYMVGGSMSIHDHADREALVRLCALDS